jgi:hypothetical protein
MLSGSGEKLSNPELAVSDLDSFPDGFGQEMNVREKVDEKAAGAFGGWSDLNLMRNTYTHAEDTETKINEALRRGLVKAEIKTKLKLRKEP